MTDEKLRDRANDYPEIKAFVKKHHKAIESALGVWSNDDVLTLMLATARRYAGPSFPLSKDNIARLRCDIITQYLRGEINDSDEFRIALDLLLQAFNAAVDTLWYQERERWKPKPPRLPPNPRRMA